MATELRFRMSISLQEASRYYEGRAQSVKVLAENGQTIRFPAQHIRPFIDQQGVHGYFSISFDDNHKLLAINKL